MKREKVLFLVPPSYFLVTGFSEKKLRYSASGATMLAANLDKNLYDVDFIDIDALLLKTLKWVETDIEKLEMLYDLELLKDYLNNDVQNKYINKIIKLIPTKKKYDYILCSCPKYPTNYEESIRSLYFLTILMKYFRKKNKETTIIWGGRRTSYIDVEKWKSDGIDLKQYVDLIVYNSIPLTSITNILKNKTIAFSNFTDFTGEYKKELSPRKLYGAYPKGILEVSVPPKGFNNLLDLKYSYKEIFDFYHYDIPNKKYSDRWMQQASLYFTKGCRGKCAFCHQGSSTYISLDFETITQSIEYYVKECGFNSFFFKNSAFNGDRLLTEKICNWIVKNNLKITWSDCISYKNVDQGYFNMLFEAGCRTLCVGAETINDNMLKYVKKGLNVEKTKKALRESHNAGIWNVVSFIFGLPFETSDASDNAITFFKENIEYINHCSVCEYQMMKDSDFYLNPAKYNLFIDKDKTSSVRGLSEPLYSEIGGRGYSEIKKFKKELRNKFLTELNKSLEGRIISYIPQHLLFALYDIFDNKKQDVQNWINENYSLGGYKYYERFSNKKHIKESDEWLRGKDFGPKQTPFG